MIQHTGHDYYGKPREARALWTWNPNIKNIKFLDYDLAVYFERVIKMGAEVQSFGVFKAVHNTEYIVATGFWASAGIIGGYPHGGRKS